MEESPRLDPYISSTAAESLYISTTESDLHQKAWHICGLLLSIGRPTPLSYLASRCSLFQASSELIRFLCSICNSPISISRDGLYVTLSRLSLSAFASYVSNSGVGVEVLVPMVRDFMSWSVRKRNRDGFGLNRDCDEEGEKGIVPVSKRMRNDCEEVRYCLPNCVGRTANSQARDLSSVVSHFMLELPTFPETSPVQLRSESEVAECIPIETCASIFGQTNVSLPNSYLRHLLACELNAWSVPPIPILDNETHDKEAVYINPIYSLEGHKPETESRLEVRDDNDLCEDVRVAESKIVMEDGNEKLVDLYRVTEEAEIFFQQSNTVVPGMPSEREFESSNKAEASDDRPHVRNNPSVQENCASAVSLGALDKQLARSSRKTANTPRTAVPKARDLCNPLGHGKAVSTSPEKHYYSRSHKTKQIPNDLQLKDRKGQFTSRSSKDPSKQNVFPDFDSYIVEEEEGSGGYGTVYRARRKSDGLTFAIKCPHADAHKHHVNNELRMLEHFGGKSFVIKYEGCFKSGDSDCFVLQHVEHDRPEILKREIDVFQLQWYGYCMFKALASLHKQGIVHRDVKPGNFLFSRKTNKGYLIDFNLAMNFHQKYKITNKSKMAYGLGPNHGTPRTVKSQLPTSSKKHQMAKSSNTINHEATKVSRSTLPPNSLKKAAGKLRARSDYSRWNQFNSQGADGSGITSAKDGTSTRNNPSGERLREPLPCHGRKELISFLQETMTSPNHEVSKFPTLMRKRVAALPGKVEKELLCLTPMPVRSTNRAVAGAGLTNQGDGNLKKEGPCAGTKGFRAPEVCLRSAHQGPKIDIWSAGVTLLYLMIGRTPFTGDPEQNIKEIATLRGSEDLWEVAKLHNRESSFPEELYDTRYLTSIALREWCRTNTKRKEFLEVIPRSLFDLVDKCLTVNPRLRISAEDALKHDFFAPIHEILRKQRLLRQGHGIEINNKPSLESTNISRQSNVSHEQGLMV